MAPIVLDSDDVSIECAVDRANFVRYPCDLAEAFFVGDVKLERYFYLGDFHIKRLICTRR